MGYLRFLLASVVALTHLDIEDTNINYFENSTIYISAIFAVKLFFVISGFLIPFTLNKNYNSSNFFLSTISYYINRVLRIYPLYFFALLIFFFEMHYLQIINVGNNIFLLPLDFFISNFKLIFSNNLILPQAWSLDIELRWYLYFPIILIIGSFFKKYRLIFYFFVLLLSNTHFAILNIPFYQGMGNYFNWFFLGLIFFEIHLFWKIKKNILIKFLPFFIILIPFTNIKYTEFFLIIAIFILCMNINTKSSRLDKMLGDLSYPIFILHLPTLIIIYLQVNKYFTYFFFNTFEYIWIFKYIISYFIFCIFSLFALYLIQAPIDNIRSRIRK